MQNDILAIGTQNTWPKINLAGSFFTPNIAGVIHKAIPATKNTRLNA